MSKQDKRTIDDLDREDAANPEMQRLLDEAEEQLTIAQLIYDARTDVGLTQQELAERIGTTQSAIARLESADYAGQSLRMLRRVADALDRRLELRLVTK